MDRDDDGETSYKYNTFVDDVAFEPTYLQALPTAAGRNVATLVLSFIACFILLVIAPLAFNRLIDSRCIQRFVRDNSSASCLRCCQVLATRSRRLCRQRAREHQLTPG